MTGQRLRAVTAGDQVPGAFDAFVATVAARWPFRARTVAKRMAHGCGTRIDRMLGAAASVADLGPALGSGLFGAEVDYLLGHEGAETAEDLLSRRTKLGLHGGEPLTRTLLAYLERTVGVTARLVGADGLEPPTSSV